MMGLALFKERRMDIRKNLTGLLPGRLKLSDGKDLDCRPVNVSESGLGILSEQRLQVGSKIELLLKAETIELSIQWIKPDFGKREIFRYGLVCTDRGVNLEQLFLNSGCLK